MSLFSVSLVSFWNSQDLSAEQVQRFLGPSSNNSGLLSFEFKIHGLEGSFFKIWSQQSSHKFKKLCTGKLWIQELWTGRSNCILKNYGMNCPVLNLKMSALEGSMAFKNPWAGKPNLLKKCGPFRHSFWTEPGLSSPELFKNKFGIFNRIFVKMEQTSFILFQNITWYYLNAPVILLGQTVSKNELEVALKPILFKMQQMTFVRSKKVFPGHLLKMNLKPNASFPEKVP